MKTKYLLLVICLLSINMVYAQNNTFKSLFEKYENEDDVTIISISRAMFNMMSGSSINTGNVDLKNIAPKIESLLIITSDKSAMKEKMALEFKSVIDKNKDYEELMRIRDGKSNVIFNAKKKGNIVNELIMFVNDENEFVAIQILGNFTLDDVQNITKEKTQ